MIAEDMESGGVHAALVGSDQATEGVAIPLTRPVEVRFLSHTGSLSAGRR